MENELDIRYLLSIARRRWAYFVAPVMLIGLVAAAVSVLLPPVYVSSARILIESQQIPQDFVRSSITSAAAERIQVIEQRVMTRSNLLNIARKFGLMRTQFDGMSSTEIVGSLKERASIELVGTNQGRRGGTTIGFTVSFEDETPSTAAQVAGELVTLILAEDARSRRENASETTEFLEDEAQRVESELVAMEAQIAEYKAENQAALPNRLPFHLSALAGLRDQAADVEQALAQVADEIELARLRAAAGAPIAGETETGDPLVARLEQMNRELAEASAIYAESHPVRKRLQTRIAALERQIGDRETAAPAEVAALPADEEAPSDTVASRRDDLVRFGISVLEKRESELQQRKTDIQTEIAAVNAVIARTSDVELGLTNLSRRLETSRSKLNELWRKHSEARLGERLEDNKKAERFEVLEQPTVPTEPSSPNRFRILAMGMFVAFGAGGAGVVLPELMDRSLRTPSQLTSKFEVRPLAVIPYFVSPQERRRRLRWRLLVVTALLLAAVLAVLAVHLYYMPLDLLAAKIAQRFGI